MELRRIKCRMKKKIQKPIPPVRRGAATHEMNMFFVESQFTLWNPGKLRREIENIQSRQTQELK